MFAVVALGYWYGRVKKPDMRFANQLNMEIFVPALVFSALASKSFDIEAYWLLAVGGAIVILGSGLLAWPVGRFLGIDSRVFVPPMMFSNCGNMGLPLAILAFGEQALPAAVMLPAHFDLPKGDKRREFLRARRNALGGADVFPNQSSGVLTSAVWADGLIDNPPGNAIARGDLVQWGVVSGADPALWVLHTSRRLAAPKVRAFVDFLCARYPDMSLVLNG